MPNNIAPWFPQFELNRIVKKYIAKAFIVNRKMLQATKQTDR